MLKQMKDEITRLHADEEGAAMTEYAIVVAGIAVVAETAAIEGARLAAVEGYSVPDGASRTRDVLEAGLGVRPR